MTEAASTPKHLGIIMDGNRRWAKARGLPVIEGHRAGYKTLKALLPYVIRKKIPFVTIYAFSTENWHRNKTEVSGLMRLLQWVVKNQIDYFVSQNVQIRMVGSWEHLPDSVARSLHAAERATADCTGLLVGICFNYGGQQELVDTVKHIVASGVAPEAVTAELIAEHLYVADLPPLDMVIRTSGEQRLSGFMLWRSSYAELYFDEVMWPDFSEEHLAAALDTYAARQRRFGN